MSDREALERINARLRGEWHDPTGDLESDIAGVVRAALSPSSRSIRVNITLPEDLVAAIDAHTRNRSGFLSDAAKDLLAQRKADAALAKIRSDERRSIEKALPARHRFVKGWPLHLPTIEEAAEICAGRRLILAHHGLDDAFHTPKMVQDRFAEMLAAKAAKGQ